MTRSQVSAQVFVYILSAVVVGIILLIGYKAISAVMNTASQAPIDNFKSEFSRKVEEMSRGYGSTFKYSFKLPDKFDQICIIDSQDDKNKFKISPNKADNEFIKDIITENVQKNVFLMNEGIIEDSFYVRDLDILVDYLCVENIGKQEVWFDSMGKTACLKKTQNEVCG